MVGALLAGLGIGLLVALQVGPIFLLCARTSARFGFRPGAAIGMGAATVDLGYAVLGALGATALLQVTALRLGLGLIGAAVLVYLGARTLWDAWRVRDGGESDLEVISPSAAYRTALMATASNPLTILTWAAVFSGAAVSEIAGSPAKAAAFVVGTALGVRYVDMEANPLAVETYDAKVTRARDDRELWDLSREFASGAIAEGWE